MLVQSLDALLESLSPITVDWKDETAERVIAKLSAIPRRDAYAAQDVQALLDENFDDGLLICRLFVGLSKDKFSAQLGDLVETSGIGVTSYRSHPGRFTEALEKLGVYEAMAEMANRELHWSDVLVERLRSGRGSAIAGQKRGRSVENFAETIVRKVFGEEFDVRCTFTGPRGTRAKCDIAIPDKDGPRILIEAKGYEATGSKMTDVIGDIEKIIAAKRPDTAFLLFTDGLSWRQRKSDLRKIVEYQNTGGITRIYTYAMAAQFEADLRQLKREYRPTEGRQG